MREESTMRRVAGMVVVALVAAVLASGAPRPIDAAVPTFPSVPIASWRLNGEGYAVLKVGNVVYVGGSFSTARNATGSSSASRSNLAAFDATTGELLTGFRADTNGTVRDIQSDGTSIFVAGTFTTIGGVSRSRVAALDPSTGAVRTGFRADTNGTVRNLSLGGGKLYVGGAYTTIGGVARTRAAAVSPTTGAVDPTFVPNIDGSVYSIAATPDGSRVYVGGPFTTVNGASLADLAVLDGSTGATAATQLSNVVGFTDELEVSPDGSRLVAGHSGIPGVGNRTQVYNTTTGARTWRQSVDGDVQGVHVVGDTVYSGFHDGIDGEGSSRMVANNLSSGARDDTFHPLFDRFMGVRAVGGDSEALVVAGDFSTVSGRSVEGFAIFRPGTATTFAGAAWGYESWRYLDDGSDQGTAWQAPGFNDASWKSGRPKFGFGVNEIDTSISYGSSSSNKYVTTYFRKTVNLTEAPVAAALYTRLDDGAVVYVNGVEATRDNMPTGPVGSTTFAASDRSRSSGDNSRYLAIDPTLLHAGTNTIAIEVHLASRSASSMQLLPTFVAYTDGPPNQAPSASFSTSPSTGVAPLAVSVDGSASTDADGSVVSWAWNFGNGTTATGATSSTTYTTAGTYTVTLTVTDDDGATNTTTRSVVVTSTPVDPPPGPPVAVPRTATWRYLDNGTDQGTAWRGLGYDDSAWGSGIGEFGYGDGDETTVVSYGPSSGSKYPTTYFRHVFTASAVPATLTFSMRLDDGAVVYLNGTEVARYNMGTGAVTYTTRAPAALSGSGETLDRQFSIDPNLITPGANVIAVEVHQNTLGSSDLSFWGDLTSTASSDPPPPPPNQAPAASFSTSPSTGVAPLAVSVDGSASTDADGSVVSWAWNFGNGTTATGATSSTTYTTAGTYTVTLTVTDDDGATNTTTRSVVVTSTPVDPPPGPPVAVPRTATWRYLDNGTDQGTAWRGLGYDDSAWGSGIGEFGYGDGDETTVVSYGPSSGSKYPTTYFRHVFTASAVPATLTFSMRLDDGAVVYLNGTEVARYNMGTGAVTYTTRAPAALSGSGETLDRQFSIDPNLITPGANVIAVEVHQNTLGSSDLSFWGDLTST